MEPRGKPTSADDLHVVFDLVPVGLCVLRQRVIQRCNPAFAEMFGYAAADLDGQCIAMLYPSREEFERIGRRGFPLLREHGLYADERIMKHRSGELFWCHVVGRPMYQDDPFDYAVWMFENISARRPCTSGLTARERQIAQLLAQALTSKQIARELQISPRTVEAHRARLLRKMQASTPNELLLRLLNQPVPPGP